MPPTRKPKQNKTPVDGPLSRVKTEQRRLPVAVPISAPEPATAVAAKPEPGLPPSSVLIPPINKLGAGLKDATFRGDGDWDSNHRSHIGTTTRHIKFGTSMKLTDAHIHTIIAFGPRVCKKLLSFTAIHDDVTYTAHNDALGVHDSSLVALAQACPNLSKFTIQGVSGLGDACLLALYEHCPKLNFIEIRGHSRNGYCAFTETAFTALRDHPDWMPKLKKLRLSFGMRFAEKGSDMKAMREVGKLRPTLLISRVTVSEEKKWGDWELEEIEEHWKKGRTFDPPLRFPFPGFRW